jgi:putative PIN family toxin of toxin-antitoxin system
MIRVVLDANVYVSAVLKPSSNPGQIVDLVRRNAVHLIVSPDILAEVKAVLLYPRLRKLHRRSPKWLRAYVLELSDLAEMIPGDVEVNAIKDDPSDNIYLACAVEGKADLIVSGDRHLKDLKSFRQIPIVDPAKFLQVISKGSGK